MTRMLLSPLMSARLYALLMCAASVFQLLLVLGAPWGDFTQGGTRAGVLTTAMRLIAATSMVVLLLFAAGALAWHGEGPLRSMPARWIRVVNRITLAYAFAAVALNLLTPSTHERTVWAPFSVVALLLLLRARSRPGSDIQEIE